MTRAAAVPQSEIERMIRAAQKAGLPVTGLERHPDGTVRLVFVDGPGIASPDHGPDEVAECDAAFGVGR